MSPLDPPVPPAGEDVHIPGPSVQPLLLTIGVLVAWIRGARTEFEELPAEHGPGH